MLETGPLNIIYRVCDKFLVMPLHNKVLSSFLKPMVGSIVDRYIDFKCLSVSLHQVLSV